MLLTDKVTGRQFHAKVEAPHLNEHQQQAAANLTLQVRLMNEEGCEHQHNMLAGLPPVTIYEIFH